MNNSFLKKKLTAIGAAFRTYQNYAEKVTGFNRYSRLRDVVYWRQKLFSVFTVYFIPVSFIALIPGVWMSLKESMWSVAAVDIGSVAFLSLVIFSKKITLSLKKVFVACTLYVIAIMLISTLGLFGPGMLYLLATTVFISVMFSRKYAYLSVAAHAITCTIFGVLIAVNPFNLSPAHSYELGGWIAFSSNLIFLSLVSAMLINSIIGGLEKTVIRENNLNRHLEAETLQKDELNKKLSDSASQYKTLFFENPKPMWVADPFTLQMLQVNEAASRAYGYGYEEFTTLSIPDIRAQNLDIDVMQVAENVLKQNKVYTAVTRHRKKNGQAFPVEVSYNVIAYQGKKVLLGIAKDITEQVEYINAIKQQNKKLTEIAFIQSHLVRAPLTRVMGLTSIIAEMNDNPALIQELEYLKISATELDDIICKVVEDTDRLQYRV